MKKLLFAVYFLIMTTMCFFIIADDDGDHHEEFVIKITVGDAPPVEKTGDVIICLGDVIDVGLQDGYINGNWNHTFNGDLRSGKPTFSEVGVYIITVDHATDEPVVTDPNQFYEDSRKVTVVSLDLTIYNGGSDLDNGEEEGAEGTVVADDKEESEGAYILVNWDDDDGDYDDLTKTPEPDLTQGDAVGYVTVANEDNLAKLIPNVNSGSTLPEKGFVILECAQEGGKVSFWSNKTKGTKLTFVGSPKQHFWNLENSTHRSKLQNFINNGIWVEGMVASGGEKDVTIKLKYNFEGHQVCDDKVKATIVMINLGNVVGREVGSGSLKERGHVGMVARYDGDCIKTDFTITDNYILYEGDGAGNWDLTEPGPREIVMTHVTDLTDREFFGSMSPFLTSFTNATHFTSNESGYIKRLKVIKVGRWMVDNTASIAYDKFNTIEPGTWNGDLNDIEAVRCDGFVEVCYEFNNIPSWGKINNGGAPQYLITIAANQDDHNEWQWGDDPEDGESDFWGWLMPITQIGFADEYVDANFPPYTSGTFDYTANNLNGTFWTSAFSKQTLLVPNMNP